MIVPDWLFKTLPAVGGVLLTLWGLCAIYVLGVPYLRSH
jgi:hypothetical protein